MGHYWGDAVYKIPHKLKAHWQNKLSSLILVSFKVLYRTRSQKQMLYMSNTPLIQTLCFTTSVIAVVTIILAIKAGTIQTPRSSSKSMLYLANICGAVC